LQKSHAVIHEQRLNAIAHLAFRAADRAVGLPSERRISAIQREPSLTFGVAICLFGHVAKSC
jgi:hypothetical protein